MEDTESQYMYFMKTLEWMCDYCVEEEEIPNTEQLCQICLTESNQPEVLKVVKDPPPQHSVSARMKNRQVQYAHLFCAFWFPEVEAADL